MRKIDINVLNQYKKDGKLISSKHPTHDLIIWNYSDSVQYDSTWDDLLLICRGLVTDTEGNVINNPIPKFFNHFEPNAKYGSNPKFFKKYDGSLILIFRYKNDLIIASRGSFTSEQVDMVKELKIDSSLFKIGFTYCFELIHPDNRIVVDYGDKKQLILLAVRENNGKELDLDLFKDEFEIAQTYSYNIDFDKIAKLNINNEEGYVVLFDNGERLKIKFEEYFRLHKLLTNITEKDIVFYLSYRMNLKQAIDGIPDELYKGYKIIEDKYIEKYHNLVDKIMKIYLDTFHLDYRDFTFKHKDSEYYDILKSLYRKNIDIFYKLIFKKIA